MEGEWLTYEQAAERLNVSPEAVRQKAIRGRWQRTIGNDKLARVRLPDGWPNPVRTPFERPNEKPVRTPSGRASDASLIKALEAHVAKEQLSAAEARAVAADAQRVAELVAERARADKQLADLGAGLASERARTEAERAKAEKAIAELVGLADRLAAIAEERARPWWRRLRGL
jgi:hypothetical protein